MSPTGTWCTSASSPRAAPASCSSRRPRSRSAGASRTAIPASGMTRTSQDCSGSRNSSKARAPCPRSSSRTPGARRAWRARGTATARSPRRTSSAATSPGAPSRRTSSSLDEGWIPPRPIEKGDLQVVLNAYRNAVRRARAAGFEILELHAAHGYLLHTFLSPLSNERTRPAPRAACASRSGGAEVRKAWPADKPLFVRVSSIDDVEGGWSIEDTVAFSKAIENPRAWM